MYSDVLMRGLSWVEYGNRDSGPTKTLNKLEQRIEDRRQELQRKAQVISLAPEVENVCFALPV